MRTQKLFNLFLSTFVIHNVSFGKPSAAKSDEITGQHYRISMLIGFLAVCAAPTFVCVVVSRLSALAPMPFLLMAVVAMAIAINHAVCAYRLNPTRF